MDYIVEEFVPLLAEVFLKALRAKQKWIEDYENISKNADELLLAVDFLKEGLIEESELQEQFDKTLQLIEAVEFKNMLSDEGDVMSAVIQITAGAGGTESCDWVAMLMRMYMMFEKKRKLMI